MNIIQCSKCSQIMIINTHEINFTDIKPLIYYYEFLSSCEKVRDNKEFSRENSKPCCES